LQTPPWNHGSLSSSGAGGSGGNIALRLLDAELNSVFTAPSSTSSSPSNSNHRLRKSLCDNEVRREFVPEATMDNPAEVYHTVHGGRKYTILASRRPEPFSKIVRRHPSNMDVSMPSLIEQLSNASSMQSPVSSIF
jgi:hypothetical protein